jgi:hypothetical protein
MLRSFNPQNGRMEQFDIKGTHVVLNLAKNPAGFNQNVSIVMDDPKEKDVIIVINDNAGDGIDVSWLWDVDFDRFAAENIRSITVSGIRRHDMKLRMKYVGIQAETADDVKAAIEARIAEFEKVHPGEEYKAFIDGLKADLETVKAANPETHADVADDIAAIEAEIVKAENCGHACHKDGFLGFLWKIANFFSKLFKLNPVCECGAAHY